MHSMVVQIALSVSGPFSVLPVGDKVLGGASRPWPMSRPWGSPSGVARSGAPMIGGGGPLKATGVGTCPARGV